MMATAIKYNSLVFGELPFILSCEDHKIFQRLYEVLHNSQVVIGVNSIANHAERF